MAKLILGPMLRYVGQTDATVWVETDEPCEVEVLGAKAPTFAVGGHHYALVVIDGLEAGSSSEYQVALDGERAWPPEDYDFPAPIVRTFRPDEQIELLFGSCRVAAPHEPPYTLPKELDEENGRGFDALHALARSVLEAEDPQYPDLVFVCGDQVYADEVSIETLDFIRSREDRPPGAPEDQVCDFEEYTRLYRESWEDPVIRWFWSTVSSSMVIDDHDMIDDWNISRAWWDMIHEEPWWEERVASGLVAYWIYQFLGNLSPAELAESELWGRVQEADDATELLREYMSRDDQQRTGKRWSFCRDLGTTRLIVVDARTGRCLDPGERKIVDDDEWDWIVARATEGEFDHVLFGTSVPWLLTRTLHNIEAWNEKVCDGAWGSVAARGAESMRQAVDFDHWGAFEDSFLRLARLTEELGSGKYGKPPATIGVLSGDVHHAYLADVAFPRAAGVRSHVYQAVCSPYRNALDNRERRTLELARTRLPAELTLLLAKSVGVKDPGIRWRFAEGPFFDNQIATIELDGRSSTLKLEKVPRDPEGRDERLEPIFESKLS